VSQLESLYYTKTPVTVVTSDMTYTNMAIESMTVSKSLEIGYAREVPITFRKVRITGSSTTGIPSSYGKSGSSGTTAGTASTTTGSSSSSSGSSSSGSSSSGSGSSSSGSVLYNAGKSTGIIK
jgi:hypothetical protein